MISGEKRKVFFQKPNKAEIAQQMIEAQEQQNAAQSEGDGREDRFYEELLEFVVSLANKLQACGAETYRVEETINRIVEAYGVERVDAFVIPNSIMASFETDSGRIFTKIRRLKGGETLLDGIERYTALSRRICKEKPNMQEARALLRETEKKVRRYPLPGMPEGPQERRAHSAARDVRRRLRVLRQADQGAVPAEKRQADLLLRVLCTAPRQIRNFRNRKEGEAAALPLFLYRFFSRSGIFNDF